VVFYSDIEGDPDALRLERVRRALDKKVPKLVAWAQDGRTSVLVLESNDPQHANVLVNFAALKRTLAERTDQPDIIVLVETDGSPMCGWVLKDGDRIGDAARGADGRGCYVEGQIR
jgi:hypothetical protein